MSSKYLSLKSGNEATAGVEQQRVDLNVNRRKWAITLFLFSLSATA